MTPATIAKSKHITDEQRKSLFRKMLLCRRFEERVYYLFLEGRMPGTIHQAQGQEASAVGVCSVLRPGERRNQHAPPA